MDGTCRRAFQWRIQVVTPANFACRVSALLIKRQAETSRARPSATEGQKVKQQTYTRCVRPAATVMARVHVVVHRATGGRVGRRWRGGDVGMLSTVGRHSGQRRTTPLVCLRDGTDIVVVASNGGSDRTPEGWLNLQHRHDAELELSGRAKRAAAELA